MKPTTLHFKNVKVIALDVFKSLNCLNSDLIYEMFDRKGLTYGLRYPPIFHVNFLWAASRDFNKLIFYFCIFVFYCIKFRLVYSNN